MGTGVGEAMLIGAATGAGTSALTGQDPLKGALLGGIGGAVVPGLGEAMSGGTAGATSGAAGSSGAAANIGTTAGGTALNSATDQGVAQLLGNTGTTNALTTQVPYSTAAANAVPPPNATPSAFNKAGAWMQDNPIKSAMIAGGGANMLFNRPEIPGIPGYEGPLKRFRYNPDTYRPAYAQGGIAALAPGGVAATQQGMYPQSMMDKTQYAVPSQMPTSAEVIASDYEPKVNPYTGQEQFASGGISSLGGYSDGGRMLKGPGDGMSDSIPASIAGKQPARLANGEFVVPADVVSHLGNGSTDAGAKQLYAMMDRVRKARTGTKKQGKKINPSKFVKV